MMTPLENLPTAEWVGKRVECFSGVRGQHHESMFEGGRILQIPKTTNWVGRGKVLVELPNGARIWVYSNQLKVM